MATHSSGLAWRIPGAGEPGGLPSMGLHTQLKRLRSSSKLKKKILPFATTWMDLEGIMLSEIRQRKKNNA